MDDEISSKSTRYMYTKGGVIFEKIRRLWSYYIEAIWIQMQNKSCLWSICSSVTATKWVLEANVLRHGRIKPPHRQTLKGKNSFYNVADYTKKNKYFSPKYQCRKIIWWYSFGFKFIWEKYATFGNLFFPKRI